MDTRTSTIQSSQVQRRGTCTTAVQAQQGRGGGQGPAAPCTGETGPVLSRGAAPAAGPRPADRWQTGRQSPRSQRVCGPSTMATATCAATSATPRTSKVSLFLACGLHGAPGVSRAARTQSPRALPPPAAGFAAASLRLAS